MREQRSTGENLGGLASAEELATIYAREAPRLTRFVRRRMGSTDDVADVVHDAFFRLLRTARGQPFKHPGAYLRQIAQNLLYDRARRSARRGATIDLDVDQVDISSPADQSDGIEAAQMMETFERAVGGLPPRTREVFLLHRADGLSYKEIADRLGIGVRTVEWHIAEALVRVRRAMDQ